MPSVWARSPYTSRKMGVGAKEVEPLRHVEPVASADDDQIRLGKHLTDASCFHRFHALPPQRLAHVGEHVGDIGAHGETPILDRTGGETASCCSQGDIASLRQLRREGPERLLDRTQASCGPRPVQGKESSPARARRASRTPCGTAPRRARPAGSFRSLEPRGTPRPRSTGSAARAPVGTSRPSPMASIMRETGSIASHTSSVQQREHWKKRWSPWTSATFSQG